jgi:hypothetical protein
MGEAYRARDTRLDRTVVIRILPRHPFFKLELQDCFGSLLSHSS